MRTETTSEAREVQRPSTVPALPLRLAVYPSDVCTVSILSVIFLTLSVRLPSVPTLWADWAFHGALLVGFAAIAIILSRHERLGWIANVRAFITVGVLFTLYLTLANVPFEAVPWIADPWLERADRAIFLGTSPALWMSERLTLARVEFFSFIYAIYIPYLYISIVLGCVGRPHGERNVFVTGMTLTYAIGFLGYLYLPARGPIVHLDAEFTRPLEGGFFHGMVVESIRSVGGPHGAFPSLHLGSATFACLFDLRYNRIRGLAYLPLVILIAVATVVVRYHYVVDLVAGAAIAILATWTALRWQGHWLRRRAAHAGTSAGDLE